MWNKVSEPHAKWKDQSWKIMPIRGSHIFSLKLLVFSLYTILTRSCFLMLPYFLLQSYTTVRMVFLQHKIDYAIPCLKLVQLGYTQCMFMEMNFLLQNTFSFCYLDCKLAYNRKYFVCFMNYLKKWSTHYLPKSGESVWGWMHRELKC